MKFQESIHQSVYGTTIIAFQPDFVLASVLLIVCKTASEVELLFDALYLNKVEEVLMCY